MIFLRFGIFLLNSFDTIKGLTSRVVAKPESELELELVYLFSPSSFKKTLLSFKSSDWKDAENVYVLCWLKKH